MSSPSTILVTGANGMLGAHTALRFLQLGYIVYATRRTHSSLQLMYRIFDTHTSLLNKIQWLEGDLTDVMFAAQCAEAAPVIIHCAGKVSFVGGSMQELMNNNVVATAHLADACNVARASLMVHVSSVSALGNGLPGNVIDEDTAWKEDKHNSEYSVSKYLGEMEVWRAMAEGLNACIISPAVIIGHGNWQTDSTAIISNVYRGMPFYTHGSNGMVDVADVVQMIEKLVTMNIPGQRFIACGANIKYKDLITKIAMALHKRPPYIEANRMWSTMAWIFESVKSYVSGRPTMITRQTLRTAFASRTFSNQKSVHSLQMEYTAIDDTIEKYCRIFLREQEGN